MGSHPGSCAFALPGSDANGHKSLEWSLVSPENVQTLDPEPPFSKAHTQNGEVYVLSEWIAQSATTR